MTTKSGEARRGRPRGSGRRPKIRPTDRHAFRIGRNELILLVDLIEEINRHLFMLRLKPLTGLPVSIAESVKDILERMDKVRDAALLRTGEVTVQLKRMITKPTKER